MMRPLTAVLIVASLAAPSAARANGESGGTATYLFR